MDDVRVRNYQELQESTLDDDDEDDEDGDDIYYDVETGKHYIFDGTSLVELDLAGLGLSPEEIDELVNKENEERDEEGIEFDTGELDPGELFSDETLSDLETENVVAKMKERRTKQELEQRRKARQERRERGGRPVQKSVRDLKMDIEDLIAQQVRDTYGTSWTRLNKKYNSNTGNIIAPGRIKEEKRDVPVLNVYFDQSGSWDENDLQVGFDVLAVLDEYMEEEKLIVDVQYFANNLHQDAPSARREGGTYAGEQIVEDIIRREPDNVLIMTDSDFDDTMSKDYSRVAHVDGGVWFLFRDNRWTGEPGFCKWIANRVRGDEETKFYRFGKS